MVVHKIIFRGGKDMFLLLTGIGITVFGTV
jgi:hypothetical protein